VAAALHGRLPLRFGGTAGWLSAPADQLARCQGGRAIGVAFDGDSSACRAGQAHGFKYLEHMQGEQAGGALRVTSKAGSPAGPSGG
jgi:hypothetical protein